MNFAINGRIPAFRENTVESFLQAAATGTTFVEFDVQVCWRFDKLRDLRLHEARHGRCFLQQHILT